MNIKDETLSHCETEARKHRKKVLEYIKEVTNLTINALVEGRTPILSLKSARNNHFSCRVDFKNPRSCQKFTLYLKLLEIIQSLVEKDQYSTKRDIYYQFKHLFKTQAALDVLINNLSRTIGVPRCSLNIISSPKGVVFGDLNIIMRNQSHIDCNKDRNGTLIPSLIHNVEKLITSAIIVLVVEKHATFMRLVDDSFTQKYPAIIITGKGEPDLNTRQLCHLLWKEFGSRIGFFCLTDANPFGIQIMSTYKYGSKPLEHMNSKLNVPSLEWIGLKLSDLDRFNLSGGDQFMTPLSDLDTRLGRNLLKRLDDLEEFELKNELQFILDKKLKTDLQYLQNLDNSFLCDVYLRAKLDCFLLRNGFASKKINEN